MDRPRFVYTSYIRTFPDALWQGLTDPAFTRRDVMLWTVSRAPLEKLQGYKQRMG